jgi:copper transport protein
MSTQARYGARPRVGVVVALAIALTALGAFAFTAPAEAHNELVKASPADGSTLQTLPEYGTLTFAEEVLPGEVKVWAGHTALPVSPARGEPKTMTFGLAEVGPASTVVLTWEVVDAHDGHRSGGAIRLHVTGAETSAATAESAPADGEPRLLGWLELSSKIVGYLAMALFVGSLLFLALLWPAGASTRRARAVLVGTVAAGIASSVGTAGVVLWRDSDQTVGDALATDYGRAAMSTVLIWLLAAVVVAAVLQLDAVAVKGVAWRVGAVVVSGGLIRVAGINAHATQGDERVLGIVADFLHLTAVSAWIGGLVMLTVCLLPRRDLGEIEDVVPKFSRVALVSVLMIVTSGLLLLWDISRGIDGFWTTHYARVLVIKLSLFSLVMLAAMKSKRWVQATLADAVAAHRRTAVRSFAVSVAAETVLVIAVLAAASVLVTSSPGM